MTEVEQFAREIDIPHLVHFTNIKNLQSIMENGLYPRSRLDELNRGYCVNDQLRLDGHVDSVSISIGFPNSQMFYKMWKGSNDIFCVLGLDPSVLWKYDCAFCKHNAADGLISRQSIRSLCNASSFRGMYEEVSWLRSRADQKLKSYDPTDVQAEVLVFDVIEPSDIIGAVFSCDSIKRDFDRIIGGITTLVHKPNKGFFSSRTYEREY